MKTLKIALVSLMIVALTGCTLVGASLESEGYGFTVKAEVAGFSTETGFELPGTEEDE